MIKRHNGALFLPENNKMRISFIGAGQVATQLAKHVLDCGHHIVDIFSRDMTRANHLAINVSAFAINDLSNLKNNVDIIIIAVKDDAIEFIVSELKTNALVVHTSGSTSLDVMTPYYLRSGVLYPLQTFSMQSCIDWDQVPFLLETNLPADFITLKEFALSLSPKVYIYNSEQRLNLHLAAVFACNFTNYCFDAAKQIVDQHKVDFELLYPLILETTNKAIQYDPSTVQTGPAKRGDQHILNMHQALLEKNNQLNLLEMYKCLSDKIQKPKL